jgi:hypothetical protein
MSFKPLCITLVLAVFTLPVLAQNTSTPNLDQRQVNQQNRIEKGVQSNQLTAQETLTLEKRAAKLEADKQAAKADGNVTRAERNHLQHEANRNSRKIHHKKHNARTASQKPG